MGTFALIRLILDYATHVPLGKMEYIIFGQYVSLENLVIVCAYKYTFQSTWTILLFLFPLSEFRWSFSDLGTLRLRCS